MIAGTVKTADEESLDNIKKSVKATLGGKELPINWRDAETGNVFGFTIEDIERKDAAQNLTISYLGKYIDSDSKGEKNKKSRQPPLFTSISPVHP